jgi:zinc protease
VISARSGPDVHTLLSVLFAGCFTLLAAGHARAEQNAADFALPNGMRVVVIPDHRLPVVTHMVWYRAGAADDPPGVSGSRISSST